jgi:exportin-1
MQILADYNSSPPPSREPDILLVFQLVFDNLSLIITQFIPQILQQVFDQTLGMISQDFNSFPDHRVNFFYFLKSVVNNAIEGTFFVYKLSIVRNQPNIV